MFCDFVFEDVDYVNKESVRILYVEFDVRLTSVRATSTGSISREAYERSNSSRTIFFA